MSHRPKAASLDELVLTYSAKLPHLGSKVLNIPLTPGQRSC